MPVVNVMFIWSQQTFDLIKRIYFLQPKEEIVQYIPGKKNNKKNKSNSFIQTFCQIIIMAPVALVHELKSENHSVNMQFLANRNKRSWQP